MSWVRTATVWTARFLPWVAFLVASIYFLRFERQPSVEVRWPLLVLATALALAAYATRSLLWWRALAAGGVGVPLGVAVASEFRSVLMKFLPGKIWVMLGRASEVSIAGGAGLARCTSISVGVQLLTILTGLLLGAIGVAGIGLFGLERLWLALPVLLLAALAWPALAPRQALRLVPAAWRRRLAGRLPGELRPFPDVLALVVLGWLLLGAGFALFFAAIGPGVGWAPLLLQPLANAAGIAVVVAPAGLGVREGATAAYLVELGLTGTRAIALGLLARFWIVAVELLIFLLGTAAGWSRRGAVPRESEVAPEQVAG